MVEFVERSWKNGSRAVPNTPLETLDNIQHFFTTFNIFHHLFQHLSKQDSTLVTRSNKIRHFDNKEFNFFHHLLL
jgi:hypothetical protein